MCLSRSLFPCYFFPARSFSFPLRFSKTHMTTLSRLYFSTTAIAILCMHSIILPTSSAFLLRARPFPSPAATSTWSRCFLSSSSTPAAPKKVLVPVADGSEEIESVTIIDVLVRAGAAVTVASVMPSASTATLPSPWQVTCSRGVKLVADKGIDDCLGEEWDLIACPGGLPGAEHLRDSPALLTLLQRQDKAQRLVAAICASPAVVLHTHGFLTGKRATCFPAERFVSSLARYEDGAEGVVEDGHVVTSRGPGTTLRFALTLVDRLCGRAKAEEVAKGLLVDYPGKGN